ncbi:hypothetical protein AB0L88_09710 [Saccharopolyspora shandongensis]|uniref:hypothetical protein n=1 Tax=Saccharopolyspora shandongensis TaxID=418495 RepID=UPI003439A715
MSAAIRPVVERQGTAAEHRADRGGAAGVGDRLDGEDPAKTGTPWGLQAAIVVASALLLGAAAADVVNTAQLVTIPTTLFLVVYLGCTEAGTRVLSGPIRIAAAAACLAVLAFSGWTLLIALLIWLVAYARRFAEDTRRPGGAMGIRADPAPLDEYSCR